MRSLQLIAREVKACTKCRLHETRTQAVFARGTEASSLCFVGEAPGATEDKEGSPFVGKSGKLLDRAVAKMGIARQDIYVTNIVKCRPPENRRPKDDEIAACRPYLERQLGELHSRVIVTLGMTALEGLLGPQERGITSLRGRFLPYREHTLVMPTFHPAYLLRNPEGKRFFWADLVKAAKHVGALS